MTTPAMTGIELARLVQRMRAAQKRYFARRQASDLAESRDLERRVDEALAGLLAPPPGPSLFDPGGGGAA